VIGKKVRNAKVGEMGISTSNRRKERGRGGIGSERPKQRRRIYKSWKKNDGDDPGKLGALGGPGE